MKLLIASDIHGSAYYCRKLLDCYKNEQADKLILLGDILYHGPRNDLPKDYAPKEVLAMLNEVKKEISIFIDDYYDFHCSTIFIDKFQMNKT